MIFVCVCVCGAGGEQKKKRGWAVIGQTAQPEEADRELHGLGEEGRTRKERGAEDQSQKRKGGKGRGVRNTQPA